MYSDILIIGSSAAGIAALKAIRTYDSSSSITLVTAGRADAHNTCLMSSYIEDAANARPSIIFNKEMAYSLNCMYLPNTIVTRIDAVQKIAYTRDASFTFGKVLLAVGTKPRIPEWAQPKIENVQQFHTWPDFEKLELVLQKKAGQRIALIGGGVNGLECASALAQRGMQVIVMEQNNLFPQWPEKGRRLLYDHLAAKNIVVHEYAQVREVVVKDSSLTAFILNNGAEIAIDRAVIAAGTVPATCSIELQGIQTFEHYVVVNKECGTSSPYVFAAGDCAILKTEHGYEWCRKWSQAALQGTYAGMAIAGQDAVYPGFKVFTSTTFAGKGWEYAGVLQHDDWSANEYYDKLSGEYEYYVYDTQQQLRGYIVASDDRMKRVALRKQLI